MPAIPSRNGSGSNGSANGKPAADDPLQHVRPFLFHGVDLGEPRPGDTQVKGTCPFCGGEGKLYVGLKDVDKDHYAGGWACHSCKERGNVSTFLNRLWEFGHNATAKEDLARLAAERGLLYPETLERWGVVRSILTGEWLLPGYNHEGKIVQLYRYCRLQGVAGKGGGKAQGRMALLATSTLRAALFGAPETFKRLAPKGGGGKGGGRGKGAPEVLCVAEGPWDGMAVEEVMRRTRAGADGLPAEAATVGVSMLKEHAVVAVPGANTFLPAWARLGAGREVVLLYDNDHPRVHPATKKEVEGAALSGIKKAAAALGQASEPPAALKFLCWGADPAVQHNLEMPSGCDVRDVLKRGAGLAERQGLLMDVLANAVPVPAEWAPGGGGGKAGEVGLRSLPCESWDVLRAAWSDAMMWTPGHEDGLLVMMAVAIAVPAGGEQLWVCPVSPPSTGKTTLVDGLSTARGMVVAKDTISGLFSGYQVDKEGSENLSLALQIRGKTLAVKDADSLVKHPNKPQIMSQFRALYDRSFRIKYNNKMSFDMENADSGVIFCGTPTLRIEMDESDLGQRFLICEIMGEIDSGTERDINHSAASAYRQLMSTRPVGNGEGADSPERVRAKQLTGGYLEHLSQEIGDRLKAVKMYDAAMQECITLATFVAYFRSRPSKKDVEEHHRELSTRLVLQHMKLAYCLAVLLGRGEVDADVLRRVRKVALDTAAGMTLKMGRLLYCHQVQGMLASEVAKFVGAGDDKTQTFLRFLRRIKAVEQFQYKGAGTKQWRWRLTGDVYRLWGRVMDADGETARKYGHDALELEGVE
jgi:hypothetical protein